MAIQKVNNLTTHKNGEILTKDGFLKIVQHGRIQTPYRAQTLDGTNVCYLSKARVAHKFPVDTNIDGTADEFTNVPIIHANKFVGFRIRDIITGKLKECWAPFNEKRTEFYNGTIWCDRIDYSFVTTTHIYFCTLYVRRAGTFNPGGEYLGGDLIDYYAILPSNSYSESPYFGGGGTSISRYLVWDFYDYDDNDNLIGIDSGTMQLYNVFNEQNIEPLKYSEALHGSTGG